MERGDLSWSEQVPYLCRCGVSFRATRHRWIDRNSQRELRDRVLAEGPIEGKCPSCGREATGRCSWLELFPREKKAVLVLGGHQRAELNDELVAHLTRASRYEGAMESWILRPDWRFEDYAKQDSERSPASAVPVPLGNEAWPARPSVGPGPKPPSGKKDSYVTDLLFVSQGASVDLCLGDEARRLLSSAALRVRPCLLRLAQGYPVLSLRIIASYLGQTTVIDAVADPTLGASLEGLEHLVEDFKVRLQIRAQSAPQEQGLCREVAGDGLGRNLRFCIDSSLEALNAGGFGSNTAELFKQSKAQLQGRSSQERLAGAKHPLAAGDFAHLFMPEETRRALVQLDAASQKANLRHLLEVEGLSVDEYEEIRQRVLTSSLEQGLCAPSRFWPRIVKLGLAPDYTAYAQELAENRQRIEQSEADDLEAAHAEQARKEILELCQSKGISLPPMLEAYLRGSAEPSPAGSSSGQGSASPAGGQSVSSSVALGVDEGDWDAAEAQKVQDDLFFEAHLLETDDAELAELSELSEAIDDDLDRIFPRHGGQASVEFMAEAPTRPLNNKDESQSPPAPPRPPVPPSPDK